ncbi:unnamed protein product [Peniophora sp. CBMAI 1063]|nr:unnamed protein product [Peniophora sp. CBMAI 1063]
MLPLGDNTFLPIAIATLENFQARSSKSWEPILSLLREMRDADLPPVPNIDLLPPIDHYLPVHEHHPLVRDVLWTLSWEVKEGNEHIPVTLSTMSLVYELYSGRTMAAFRVNYILPQPIERPEDFAIYMQPMNRVANVLFGWRGADVFYSLYPYIPRFVTRQLMSVTLHRLYATYVHIRRAPLSDD